MSTAPPILPPAGTLPPHEQLAVYFVEGGVAALSRDDFESAQENFERALELAPLQPFGYYFLAGWLLRVATTRSPSFFSAERMRY
jgi:hypothetical protein